MDSSANVVPSVPTNSGIPSVVGVLDLSANVVAQSETVASDVIGICDDIADKNIPKAVADVAALVVDVAHEMSLCCGLFSHKYTTTTK